MYLALDTAWGGPTEGVTLQGKTEIWGNKVTATLVDFYEDSQLAFIPPKTKGH